MTQLLNEKSYDRAVASGALIVNVDEPTKTVRLHPVPADHLRRKLDTRRRLRFVAESPTQPRW